MTRYRLFVLLACLPQILYAHEVLDTFLKDLHSLHAQFEQTLYEENGEALETSKGELYMQRPNKFRWIYKIPYNQLIVADSKRVWVYDIDLEQVTSKPINKALGQTPAFLLSRTTPIETDFRINELSSRSGFTRLELIPKNTQAQFATIRLKLKGKKLVHFELKDNFGQTTLITFRKLIRNPKLNSRLFRFKVPAGVDLIKED